MLKISINSVVSDDIDYGGQRIIDISNYSKEIEELREQ